MKKWQLVKLSMDLWWFIENVKEDSPTRSQQFFALRARYRLMQQDVPEGDWIKAGGQI